MGSLIKKEEQQTMLPVSGNTGGKLVKVGESTAQRSFQTSALPSVKDALESYNRSALEGKADPALVLRVNQAKSAAIQSSGTAQSTTSTNQRDLSRIKSELEDAKSAEKSAMNRLDDYMLTYSGAFDLRDPAELQALKDTATAATEARKRLEQEYNAHEGSFEDQYGEFSGVEKAAIGIIGSPFAAVDVIAQTAKSAIGGDNTMDMDTLAMQNYKKAQQLKSSATENLSGPGKFLADTGVSIAQNLYALPMNVVMPGGSLAVMGTNAAADKMAELGDQGESATRSLVRGAISGGIEAATEKIPLDSLADLVKTGGKSVIKNLLKQGGVEATEEGVAYAANYIADKLAKDPNATWDWADFANNVASGGVSGLFFGLGGTAVNRVSNSSINSNGTFLPGSGLDTPTQTIALPTTTPNVTTTAQNAVSQTQDTTVQNAAPATAQTQKNTVPNVGTEQLTSDSNMARYKSVIDGVFTGGLPSGSEIVVGETPSILQQYGAPDLNLRISQSTVRKIVYPEGYMGGKHNLGMSAMKNLPYQIADPVAILKSKSQQNSMVVITEWKTQDGQDVIVPIHLNKQGAIEVGNSIASAYGKGNIDALLGENGENILYTKNNEDIHQLLSNGLQLPEAMADDVLAKNTIPQNEESVKEQDVQNETEVSAEQNKISLDEFLGQRGLGSPISDYMDDKLRLPHGETARQKTQRENAAAVAAEDYSARRQAAIQEYEEKVRSGEIVPKTTVERLMATAHGHEDNQKTQAARRSLEKRGIDWQTGAALKLDTNGNIIKIGSEEGANPTSLATDGGAGTQSPLPSGPIIRQAAQGVKEQSAQTSGGVFQPGGGLGEQSETQSAFMPGSGMKNSVQQTSDFATAQDGAVEEGFWDSIMEENRIPFSESDVDGYYESLLEAVDQRLNRATPKGTPVTEEYETPSKGKKRAKKSPTENESVKEIVNDPDVVGAKTITGEFAQALTSSGIDYNKDFARNLDAAAGGNATIREALRNLIERPFLSAKTNYANNVRSQLNDLKKTMDGLGIKKGSKESAAVQRYGEGQYQDETGEVHEYTEAMLREEFPDTWQNIVKAAQYSRQVYDGYVDRLNETLEKIYPNAMGKAMEDEAKYNSKASFFSEMAKEQQNTLDSLQERLHERKNQLARMMEGTQRYADLQNTIRRIERQAETVRSKISSLQEQADISNAKAAAVHSRIVSGEVLRNKWLPKRTDYFHHFNEMAEGWEALKNILTTPADINSTLAGVSDFTQPKSKWAGFMQGRKGGAYTEDAVGGLLTYIPQAEYKINLDPIIAENRNIIKTLAEETEYSRNANKFIEWMTDWTNDLAGKTNPFDRAVQKVVGRKAISVAKWLSSRAKANAVVGNVRSATAQVFNLPNALVYIKSPKAWKNGAKIYGRALGGDETAKSLYAESGFLNERYLDDAVSQFDEGLLKKPEKFANWMLTVGDKEVAKLIWASAYEQGRAKSIADPIEYADDITRRSIAGRGVGEVPLMQKAVVTQLFAPFQVEVNNTWQLMKEAAGDKNVGGLLAMFALSFLMNSMTRELFGYDVAIDPFNAVIEGIEGWDKDNFLGSVAGVAGRVGGELLSNMPFGAQIGSIAISDEADREKLFGDADPSRFGTGNIGLDAMADTFMSALDAIKEEDVTKLDLMTPLTNFALPYGGKQVGRLIEGAQDLGLLPMLEKEEGLTLQPDAGSKNKNGKLRFAVDENNPFDVAKLMLLGPFSTKGGMEYLEEGYTALGEKQTSAAMEAAKMGVDLVDYMAAYRGMSKAEKESEKRAVIQNMDLTDEEKAYIYRYAMLSSDAKEKERSVFDSLVDGGSDVGLIGSTLMSIRDAEKQEGKLQVIGNAGVSEREAKELLGMVMGTDLKTEEGNATAYAKLLEAMNTALGVEEVVELKNSGANLDRFLGYTDAGMDAGSAYDLSLAAVEMREKEDIEGSFTIEENARWIQSAGLTKSQQEIAWLVTYPDWAEKAAEKGVSNSEYIQYKVATYGYAKKADKLAALRAAGFSAAEAAQLYNKIG